MGDARLTLAKEPDRSFDLILVDAFSSDAVPVHLMTAEALQLYAGKLKDDGVLVLHISNRYLDLDSVLGATLPLVPQLKGLIVSDDKADGTYAQNTSTIAVFAKDEHALDPFRVIDGAGAFTPSKVSPGRTMPPTSWAPSCRSGAAPPRRPMADPRSCAGPPPGLRERQHSAIHAFNAEQRRGLMQVDEATVRRIARLARIKITDAEAKGLVKELSGILNWVEQLDEVDTSAVEPMTRVVPIELRSARTR